MSSSALNGRPDGEAGGDQGAGTDRVIATARQISALRKPTRAAWIVNRLARAEAAERRTRQDLDRLPRP